MLRAVLFLCVCAAVAADELDELLAKLELQYRHVIYDDAKLRVPELVGKYDYPLEVHRVQTSDGYILTMHRIPHGRDRNKDPNVDRPVVFVMHGLLASSADWIVSGPGKGLAQPNIGKWVSQVWCQQPPQESYSQTHKHTAYILAEEGFDVWLGNARGNQYSREHVSLNPDDNTDFWQFSWDEIGHIDLPTMIDFALDKTNKQRLHYIGHSQGTTSFFVMCSLRAEYNEKIISMNALAPVAYMAHSGSSLMRAIAQYTNMLDYLFTVMGVGEFLPNSKIMRWAGDVLCRDEAITQEICSNILFLIGGWNEFQLNATMLPVYLGHTPAGASVHQLSHYGQNMLGKEFRRLDRGWWGNRKVYGTLDAPLYDLSRVRAPVYLHYSLADLFANVKDVLRLWSEIGNPVQKNIVPMSSFSHLDFVWRIDAKTLVYDQVIDIMMQYHAGTGISHHLNFSNDCFCKPL